MSWRRAAAVAAGTCLLLLLLAVTVPTTHAADPTEALKDGPVVPPMPLNPHKQALAKGLDNWDERDVMEWALRERLESLVGQLEAQAIDGPTLREITGPDLDKFLAPEMADWKWKLLLARDRLLLEDDTSVLAAADKLKIKGSKLDPNAKESDKEFLAKQARLAREREKEKFLTAEEAQADVERKRYAKNVRWSQNETCITMAGFKLFTPDMINILNANHGSWRDDIHVVQADAEREARKPNGKPRKRAQDMSGCQRLLDYIYPSNTGWAQGKLIVVAGTDEGGIAKFLSETYEQSFVVVLDDSEVNIPEKDREAHRAHPKTRRIKEHVWLVPVAPRWGLCTLFHMGVRPDVVWVTPSAVEGDFFLEGGGRVNEDGEVEGAPGFQAHLDADIAQAEAMARANVRGRDDKRPSREGCGCENFWTLWKRAPLYLGDTPFPSKDHVLRDLTLLDRAAREFNQRVFVDEPCWMMTNGPYGMSCAQDRWGNSYLPATNTDPSTGGVPVVTANIVVKDNADTIQATLDSVMPFVDRVNVVDWGSVDGTLQVAKKALKAFKDLQAAQLEQESKDLPEGQANKKLPLLSSTHQIKFEGDMSQLRNHALKLVSNSTTWVLEMLGGEELVEGHLLRPFLQSRSGFCGPSTDVIDATVVYTARGAPQKSTRLLRANNHLPNLQRGLPWPEKGLDVDHQSQWAYEGLAQERYVNKYAQQVLRVQFEVTGPAGGHGAHSESPKRFHILHHVHAPARAIEAAKEEAELLKNEAKTPEATPGLDRNHRLFLLAQTLEVAGDLAGSYEAYSLVVQRAATEAKEADARRHKAARDEALNLGKGTAGGEAAVAAAGVSPAAILSTPLSEEGKAWLQRFGAKPVLSGARESDVATLPANGLSEGARDICRSLFKLGRLADKRELDDAVQLHWQALAATVCAHQAESMYDLAAHYYYYHSAADAKQRAWYWLTLAHRLSMKYGCELDPKVCATKIQQLMEAKFIPMNMGAN